MLDGCEVPAPVFIGFDLFFVVFDRVERFGHFAGGRQAKVEPVPKAGGISLVEGVIARVVVWGMGLPDQWVNAEELRGGWVVDAVP
jgi:hypothetical protein